MNNSERNNIRNNDENLNSSLSASVKERNMEEQGNQLLAAQERSITPPPIPNSSMSSGGSAIPPKAGLENKNNIGEKERLNPNHGLPEKQGLNNPAQENLNDGKKGLENKNPGLQDKVAAKALQAAGVPKGVSEAASSKLGKKAISLGKNPIMTALGGLKSSGKSEAEKDAIEKEEEEQVKEKHNGSFTVRLPLKIKLILFLAVIPAFCFIIMFFTIIVAYVADEKSINVFFAKITGKGELAELYEFRSELGNGSGSSTLGMGTNQLTYNEFLSRYQNLGNVFEYFKCDDEEECLQRDEVKFYIKINDIALRYKKKYGVTLDWELLMSTALSVNLDVSDMFENFLNDYNYDDVEDYDILMNLDWDYDYKKISGYNYLSAKDYQYDLQILAKNMVTKTTTQTCTKSVKNSDGTTSVSVTKTQTDTDVEEQYFESGEEYYLTCDTGETYSISSDYRLDLTKYDEFLLEYIEHKLYLPDGEDYTVTDDNGNIVIDSVEGDSLSATMVNLALSQQGVEGSYEHNGDNNVKYNTWYYGHSVSGSAYPWCAVFVSWIVANTEYNGTSLTSILNYKTASTQSWATYFYNSSSLKYVKSAYYGGNYTPKQGDLIFFDGGCGGSAISNITHVGIVVKTENGKVVTIEGNTSNKVAERQYSLDKCDISGYGVWY